MGPELAMPEWFRASYVPDEPEKFFLDYTQRILGALDAS